MGEAKYLFSEGKYKVFKNKECPYAALLIKGGGVFKLVCKIESQDLRLFEK